MELAGFEPTTVLGAITVRLNGLGPIRLRSARQRTSQFIHLGLVQELAEQSALEPGPLSSYALHMGAFVGRADELAVLASAAEAAAAGNVAAVLIVGAAGSSTLHGMRRRTPPVDASSSTPAAERS